MAVKYTNTQWNGKKVIVGETALEDDVPVNLLIGFHGADSTPENMLIHGNRLDVKNTLMVFPEGPVSAGKGLWSWWTDGPRQKEAVADFLSYAKAMIHQAREFSAGKINADKLRICLWGFSQGGAASLVYALFGSHPIYKVASICGFLPETPDHPKNSPTSILGIYGANDEVVPAFLADHALDEMKNHGHHTTARETSQGHEVNAQNLQEVSQFFSG